jgi:hypothetical protein
MIENFFFAMSQAAGSEIKIKILNLNIFIYLLL